MDDGVAQEATLPRLTLPARHRGVQQEAKGLTTHLLRGIQHTLASALYSYTVTEHRQA